MVQDSAPIVRVVHELDGDWQFIGPVAGPEKDGCKLTRNSPNGVESRLGPLVSPRGKPQALSPSVR